MTRLRIREGSTARTLDVEGTRLTLGRAPDCDVVVASQSVSRRHAELWREAGGWTLSDLGSGNGTFVGEERIASVPLAPGQAFRLGFDVVIEIEAAPAAAAPPPPVRASAPPPPPARATAPPPPPARATTPPPPPARDADREDDADEADDSGAPPPRPARQRRPAREAWWRRTRWALAPRGGNGEWVIARPVTTVGRDEGSGVMVDDASVSRLHARLDLAGAELTVTDLKSANGTRVNGERVASATLATGDILQFGDIEFDVERFQVVAWDEVALPLGIALVALLLVVAGVVATRLALERHRAGAVESRLRGQAVESVREAIAAARGREPEVARTYLGHAASVLKLAGLVPGDLPAGETAKLLAPLRADLDEAERGYDFSALWDSAAVRSEAAQVQAMSPRAFVEHELKCYCADLGQDANLPPMFVNQVWGFVQDFEQHPGSMQVMLRRARTLQPRIVGVLAREKLPPMVAYVAWVESELDTGRVSPAGAVGLWQLMDDTARERGLRLAGGAVGTDDRTRVEKSTAAAARYISEMLKDQGPEYFMLVLASYNRGPNALRAAKQKVDQPMLNSTRKYWYLVENGLLADETQRYVPKIFAVRVIAEHPDRFGF